MTPSAGAVRPSIARWEKCGRAWMPSSVNVPPSISSASRSRAVSLSAACCLAMRSSPPPRRAAARRSIRSSTSGRSRDVGAFVSVMGSRKSYFPLRDPSRAFLLDLLAVGPNHVPLGAERVDALALDAAGLVLVGDEQVERVAVVGDLGRAVRPLGRAELGGVDAAGRLRLAAGGHGRPVGRACPGA